MSDETRTRFLAAMARQIPAERVIEVHLFAAIRQGGTESGIAVVALEREPEPGTSLDMDDGYVPPAFAADELSGEPSPYADEPALGDEAPLEGDSAVAHRPASRYTIYSARYRYTLKGLDRGKWEVSVTEEADAPLLTVDAVVRGVQRRSGDEDEVLRLSGDEFRASLPTARPVA